MLTKGESKRVDGRLVRLLKPAISGEFLLHGPPYRACSSTVRSAVG
jgi:hypothetical protein